MTGILNILAGSIAAAIKDGYFNLVTLLLPGNGTNGAQNNTFLDSSTNNFTITRNGNTTQGTFSPFSQTGWSNYFPSNTITTNQKLSGTLSSSLGTANFTLQFSLFWIASPSAADGVLFDGGTNGLVIIISSSGQIAVGRRDGTGSYVSLIAASSSTAVTANQWADVAVVRTGTGSNQFALYIGGSSVATATLSTDLTSTAANIGGRYAIDGSNWYPFQGYLSNYRISNTNRTISVPTAFYASDANTLLLTCLSNRFIDTSSNAIALTVNGSTSVQAFSPFAPSAAYSAATNGASGYFDGTGDYLTVADNAALELGASDFTIEWWQYNTSSASSSPLSKDAPTGTRAWGITVINDGTLTFYIPGGSQVITSTTGTWKVNAWNFFTITRSGSTIYLSINGIVQSFSWTSTIPNTADNIYIGAQNGPGSISSYVTGYLAGIRLIVGESVSTYRANFTVPTVPPTTTSNSVTAANTKLLTNFTNGGIIDATGKNVLETVGNAQISTTQSKWGGSSMYFDGTGDYLRPNSGYIFNFGTGDFTIEFWLYLNSTSNQTFIDCRPGSSGDYILFDYNTTSKLRLFVGSTTVLSGKTLVSGQWYHIALARSGSTVKYFVDGTQEASATMTTSILSASNPYIGSNYVPGDYLNAYIDDFRVTKGYARYTANFTAPTAAFPTQ
jgi:hypothetical protein